MLYTSRDWKSDKALNALNYLYRHDIEDDFEDYDSEDEEYEREERERKEIEKELLDDLYVARYPIR